MHRILVLITSSSRAEFEDKWNGVANERVKSITTDSHHLLILNGRYYSDQAGLHLPDGIVKGLSYYIPKQFGVELSAIQVGLLYHSLNDTGTGVKIRNQLDNRTTLSFVDWYSTESKDVWDENNGESTKPLSRLAAHLDTEFSVSFDLVWNHFEGDKILEAKLNLLHSLLMPSSLPNDYLQGASPAGDIASQWSVLRGLLGDSKKCEIAWNEFVEFQPWMYAEHQFTEPYVSYLSQLRDVLLQ